MFRTILGLPFYIVGLILTLPAIFFSGLAYIIRGESYPGLTISIALTKKLN